MRTIPPSTLFESPWRIAVFDSGWSSMLGTSKSSVAGSMSFHESQFVAEANHLDGEIILDEGKLSPSEVRLSCWRSKRRRILDNL